MILYHGLPGEPVFYFLVFATALLWCIADVAYLRAIPVVGAGVVSRLLPSAVILTFFLWFPFDHKLLLTYLAQPMRSGLVLAIIFSALFFAMRLRHCPVTLKAVKMIWFVLFVVAIGPIVLKLTLYQSPPHQGPYAFVFVQALMMVACWSAFYSIRRPEDGTASLFCPLAIKAAACVSVFSGFGVVLKTIAMIHTPHPAYLSVLSLTDSLIIVLYHRLTGRREEANIRDGLGIVACAMLLVVVTRLLE
jgi:hypothetical protein